MNDYLSAKNADYIEELSKRPEMSKWREEIKKDANKFYQFCVHYDLIPNIFVLHEVCRAALSSAFADLPIFFRSLSGSTGRLR